MKILLISPCHKDFGGYYRAQNISTYLGQKNKFLYSYRNPFLRLYATLRNLLFVPFYDLIHIFEVVQPETLFPGLLGIILRKKVVLDIGDEWLDSPTYHSAPFWKKRIIYFLDSVVARWFKFKTVTSNYLMSKYPEGKVIKIVNGVNVKEFEPLNRIWARHIYGYTLDDKIVVCMGNTWVGERKRWLDSTIYHLKEIDPQVLIINRRVEKYELAKVLGIADLILFPTGSTPNEKACFPIRVGTFLNAQKPIATDDSDTEFHNILNPYYCLIKGTSPQDLAIKIFGFLRGNSRALIESNAHKAKNALSWYRLIEPLREFYGKV